MIIEVESRCIVHAGITRHPTDFWLAQQLREATPFGQTPRYLIHDRGGNHGEIFVHTAASCGIAILKTPYRAPKASAIYERLMGSLRREYLDLMLVPSERHLQQIVTEYIVYFNRMRPIRVLGIVFQKLRMRRQLKALYREQYLAVGYSPACIMTTAEQFEIERGCANYPAQVVVWRSRTSAERPSPATNAPMGIMKADNSTIMSAAWLVAGSRPNW